MWDLSAVGIRVWDFGSRALRFRVQGVGFRV